MVRLARLFFFVAVALPGALVLLEILVWLLGAPTLPAIEGWTGSWCHHDPTRTLEVAEILLPVCARCTGLYLGLVAGPILGVFLPREGNVLGRLAALGLLSMVAGLFAALFEAVGLLSTGNTTRLFLGLLLTTGPMALGMVGARILGEALVVTES